MQANKERTDPESSVAESIVTEPTTTKPVPAEPFAALGLTGNTLKGVKASGYTEPTPIQTQAVPLVLSGRDMIGQAETGSGKTAAFALPAIEKLKNNKSVEVLVLVPTRELCQQVVDEFTRLGKAANVRVVSVVGGQPAFRQIELVNRGAQVVVATPGRLLDHLSSKRFKKFQPQLVVLDEADEMLDMGFIDDIKKILGYCPKDRQTLLFSATMPGPIAKLAREELTDPEHLKLVDSAKKHESIEQVMYVVRDGERVDALCRIIDVETPEKAVVFCRTREDTNQLYEILCKRGVRAKAIHGDLTQGARTQAMNEIKRGSVQVLIATDVASRGLDINDLSHVFNFHLPDNVERYTHRIGRTGRAGKKGKAITFATPSELRNHRFFSVQSSRDLAIGKIPRKNEVESKWNQELMDEISATEISPNALNLCHALTEHTDVSELLCRLISHIESSRAVAGPDMIGMTPEQVEKFKANLRVGGRGGSSDFPRGFRRSRPQGRARPQGGQGGGAGAGRRPHRDRPRKSRPGS